MRNRLRPLAPLMAVGLVAGACTGTPGEGGGADGGYPREETLYTTGTQWGPPNNWNPLQFDATAGTEGLVYEPLFLYDPQKRDYIPWLAESQEWVGDDVHEIRLREGIEWQDGTPFTAEDVVFTLELGRTEGVPYGAIWDWIDSVAAVDDHTVRVTFSDTRYQEWMNWIYENQIVPKHLWEDRSAEEISAGANEEPVGTGAYVYHTHDQDRMVWKRNEDWWAQDALDLDVAPTYVVDIVNTSNEAVLGLLQQGEVDISNNFLPGITELVEENPRIRTYYSGPPYMLSTNTSWLVMNTTKEPMDDPEFRKALAHAIDTEQIVEGVYNEVVREADPTGLLPSEDRYIDDAVVEELGFDYDPERARELLAEAGYEDTTGDDFVETPDGKRIELSLIIPSGWTDWMEAGRVIADNAQTAGIDLSTDFIDSGAVDEARTSGDFDMLLNNWAGISNTPWTTYNYMFGLPVRDAQEDRNFGRYENEEAWELVRELSRTPIDDREAMAEITSRLQEIQLTEMPLIPLWYNGLWSQYNTSVWTGWPSEEDDTSHHMPSTSREMYGLGSIFMYTEIEPAAGGE